MISWARWVVPARESRPRPTEEHGMITAMKRLGLAVALAVLGLAAGATGQARAGLLLDDSPGTTGAILRPNSSGQVWSNEAAGQNFADSCSFAGATTLDGMDIY